MKPKILFLHQSEMNWYNIYPLYCLFSENTDFICEVMTVPQYLPIVDFNTENKSASEMQEMFAHRKSSTLQKIDTKTLEKQGISYFDGANYIFSPNEYELVVYGYPYENLLDEKFHMKNIQQFAKKIAYLPYGIDVSRGQTIDMIAYELPIHYAADAIFMQSEPARQKFLSFHPTSQKRIFALSTPRFDELYHLSHRPLSSPQLLEQINGRFTVLWNSHFTFLHNKWSTLPIMFEAFISYFSDKIDDIALVWRPHPNTRFHLLESKFVTPSTYASLMSEIKELGIIVDESENHLDAFQVSDCLLSDASSLCIEYIGTGKPMMLLHNPAGTHFFDDYFEDMMKFYDRCTTPQEALSFVENIKNGKDSNKTLRKLAQKKFAYKFDGKATERIYKTLLEMINH